MTTEAIIHEVSEELDRAESQFPKINTPHEGYAIILEELDEFWDECKVNQSRRSLNDMRNELIQVAAMAIRTIKDTL
jgi:hypothetical protein